MILGMKIEYLYSVVWVKLVSQLGEIEKHRQLLEGAYEYRQVHFVVVSIMYLCCIYQSNRNITEPLK